MPVTGATTRNDYVSSSGQTVFPYTFQTLLASDIKVLKNGVALTLNNDYSVSNAGVAGGGSITLNVGASTGDSLSVFLAMPIDRTTQYQNAGDFLASDVNGDFDKGYIAMNQLQTDIKRAIGLADADPTVNMTLPLTSIRANKYLKFNALGAVTVSDTAGSDTSDDLGLANVMDYGAVGDGVADDTLAARSCIAYAIANNLIAYFPPGDYKITGNILNYLKLVDGGQSPKIVGAGRGLTKFTVVGTQTDYVFIAYGDTTSYGNTSHPSGLLLQGFSVIGDYSNTQNIFDLAMLSYFGFIDVNTFQCKGTSLRMRECWEGDLSGLRIVRSGDDSVYALICDYYFADRKADSACNNINFGKDFQCEASAWSAIYWGRNTRKCLFQGKIHPLLSSTYTVPAFVLDGATNCTVIGANISWKNVKSVRLTNASGYIPSENIITNSTISGGVELVGSCRRNTIVYNTGGISEQQDAYIATSGQTVFAYTFLAAAEKNVLVTKNGEELVLQTDYTLSGIGNAGGGNATLTVGATTGDDVVVSQVEDQFVTIAGGADNIVFGNNPSGAGVEVTYASGFNLLPTVFHGKDTVATFESNDTLARVELKDPNGSSRVGTQSNKLILEAAHTGGATNAKISFEIAGTEVAKIDSSGNITANNLSVNLATYGGSPTASASVNTSAIESAWSEIQNNGGRIVISEAGTWNFNNSTFARTTKPIEIEAVDGVLLYPANPQATTWMWDFQSDTGVTQVSFTNVRVSGQKADNTREEFLGIRVGPSNNLTAYKCFGRYVNGTAWQFLRPHNSEIDMTTFFCGKDGDTDANRFAMMITGILDAPNGQDDVFNDVRLSGTSEKDYYGWVVEGGTVLRTTSQLKMHGSAYSKRAFQLHRVAEFDVEITATQRYNKNGFVHFSDAGNGGGITLFQNCTGASLPIRGTAALSNATNLQVYTGDVSGYPTAAPASAIDAYVFDMASQFSGVKCTGLLSPQATVDVAAGNFVNGIQYRISDLGSAGNAAWVTYTGVSATYKVGDFFTGTSNNSALLTSAVVTRRYAMVGLAAPGDEFARPYLGELGQTTQVFDQFLRDERTDSDRELIQEFLPSLDAAKIEQFGSQTPRFRIKRLFGQRTSNPPATFDRRGSVSGSNNDIISLERGGLKTGGIGVEASADSSQEVTFIDSSYELAETVNAGDFVTGQRYSISNVGSAGNAAWVTFLGARPGGGDYATGDLFVAPGNGSALTGAQAQIYHLGAGLSFDKTAVLPRQDQARVDKVVSLGSADHAFNELFLGDIKILSGTGDPSAGSGTAAPQGSMFLRTDGGASTTLYVKTGGGNTEWTAK